MGYFLEYAASFLANIGNYYVSCKDTLFAVTE
jgi:hypothetical protein